MKKGSATALPFPRLRLAVPVTPLWPQFAWASNLW
jgi:hypothetical protein